jgi:putative transcriptional regulator
MAMTERYPKSVAERIRQGLLEGIAQLRGELPMRRWVVTFPDSAPKRTATQIVALRKALNMPQFAFAEVLNVSVKTVQAWEQGVRRPDGAALRLLQILAEFPQVMEHVPAMRYSRKLVTRGETAQGQPRRRKRVA